MWRLLLWKVGKWCACHFNVSSSIDNWQFYWFVSLIDSARIFLRNSWGYRYSWLLFGLNIWLLRYSLIRYSKSLGLCLCKHHHKLLGELWILLKHKINVWLSHWLSRSWLNTDRNSSCWFNRLNGLFYFRFCRFLLNRFNDQLRRFYLLNSVFYDCIFLMNSNF